MDLIAPKNSIEFEYGWYRRYDFNQEADALFDVLEKSKKENDVQRYIKEGKKWFIPASLFENYDFGHHEAYIVPEQSLGSEYRVDYMLLGRNSIGYHIVLVEFEAVNVDFKLHSSNMESEAVRKGIVQVNDWKRWMDDHRDYFLQSCNLQNIKSNIPSWGIHYCLVVGRRSRMDDVSNSMRRQHEMSGLKIVTYDRLVDNVRRLVNGF